MSLNRKAVTKLFKNRGFTPVWVLIVGIVVVISIGTDIILKNKQNNNKEAKSSVQVVKEKTQTKEETAKKDTKPVSEKPKVPGLCIAEFAIQTDLPADKFYFDFQSGVGIVGKDNGKGILLYPIYAGSEESFLNRKNTNLSSFISKKGKLAVHKIEDQNNHSVIYLVQSLPYPLLISSGSTIGTSTKEDLETKTDISLLIDSMINKKCDPNPKEFKNNILTKLELNNPINLWLNSISKESKANFDLAYGVLKSRFDIDTSNFNFDDYYTTKGNLSTKSENSKKLTEPYHDIFMNKTECANYIIYKTIKDLSKNDKDSFLEKKFYKDTSKYSVEEQVWFEIRLIKFAEKLEKEVGSEKISTVHLMTNYFDQVNNDWRDVQKLTGEHCKNIGIQFQ